ncbi:MAG: prepilin-type N-terminal cleavage/methylation domain-containing protein [Candidatus Omnitrophica bacterium]|nr:prepilin-type N-terminal cleavage/methylation domain-containing protein [Candidatus Omnitrophota bacterium]
MCVPETCLREFDQYGHDAALKNKGEGMKRLNNKGFSLMELAITVGLMAVLVGVVAAGGGMMAKCRVQREAEAIESLRVAAQNYLSSQNLTFSGISITALKTAGLLPANFDPLKANSFGGDYTVAANAADNTRVDIALANVSDTAGTELINVFKAKANATTYDKASKLWTATF